MNQFYLGSSSPYSQYISSPNMEENVQNQILGLDTNSTSSTSNPFGVEEQKDFGKKVIEKLVDFGRDIDILGDRGFQTIDTEAPFMTIGDKSFFLTKEGKADTSDNPSVVQKLLDDNKMTSNEAREARKTGEFILGTVAPAPKVDGPLPQSIVDPDDPSKRLRRLYSPITGGLLDQYGDRIAQESLLSTVNPATGKLFVEEQRVQDIADDKFKAFQQFAASTPQTYARTQEDIAAKEAASRALQASIAQKDATRDLAQRARMLQMKPEELLAMETPAPAPQQSMYGAAQLIKALEGYPEAQAAIVKQFGVPPTPTSKTSTPLVDTEIRDGMARPPEEPEGTITPRIKPQNQSVSTDALNISPAVEGSAQANSYIDRLLTKYPEVTRGSIIDLLRKQGIIFSPQQTTR